MKWQTFDKRSVIFRVFCHSEEQGLYVIYSNQLCQKGK